MNKLKCIIIGQNSLVQQCSEIILSSGHQLCGIISNDNRLKVWAKNHGIVILSDIDVWAKQNRAIDYIFSIVNDIVLSDRHMCLARKGVINYHDSLLPRYAGVHATSWAIINAEKKHGITWHQVDSGIDTGDILVQKMVFIEPNETALSLNLKCYQAGVAGFKVLMKQLENDKCVALKPQNLAQRSYYPYNKKPDRGAIIDWQQSADYIDRLFRALSFGHESNRLATMKLFTPKHSYQVRDLSYESAAKSVSPGQIITLDDTCLRVGTTSGNIVIKELQELDGKSVTLKQFAKQTNLQAGDYFEQTDKKSQDKFKEICEALSPFELYWVNAISYNSATHLPYFGQSHDKDLNCYQGNYSLPALKLLPNGYSVEVYFTAIWSIYLYRLNDYQTGAIGFVYGELTKGLQSFTRYFSGNVPLTLSLKPKLTFRQAYQLAKKNFKRHQKSQNVFTRYFFSLSYIRATNKVKTVALSTDYRSFFRKHQY